MDDAAKRRDVRLVRRRDRTSEVSAVSDDEKPPAPPDYKRITSTSWDDQLSRV